MQTSEEMIKEFQNLIGNKVQVDFLADKGNPSVTASDYHYNTEERVMSVQVGISSTDITLLFETEPQIILIDVSSIRFDRSAGIVQAKTKRGSIVNFSRLITG